MVWYDEPTDLLMTQYVAVKITHKTEDIDIAIIDDYLSQLEDKLMDYFKKNFNIELLSYDCDDLMGGWGIGRIGLIRLIGLIGHLLVDLLTC